MPELVQVRFKGNRTAFFARHDEASLRVGDSVVVAVERGHDLGTVAAVGEQAARKCGVGCAGCALAAPPTTTGTVVRQASAEDSHLGAELRKAEDDIRRTVIERVAAHKLTMKVSDAEWQWDRKKLTIYFTSEKRVDFRSLVRDLAALFRTRIELRQIGARDEAKRLEGVGRCGREYCCSSWLPELRPVSLSLAKDQRLSLNPSQISGGCGRLLCCLRYEHEFYVSSRKRFPKEGKILRTAKGAEKVHAVDIFRERVLLRAEDGTTRAVALVALREEMGEVPTRPQDPPSPPSALVAFDEGPSTVTAEQAIDTVSSEQPRKRRRRRGRRGGTRRNRGTPEERGTGGDVNEAGADPPTEPPDDRE
ncbi:MAG TPA: regulatory iron-sulfur-containing complex subunit RicT [Gemmatimonadales bacterium]